MKTSFVVGLAGLVTWLGPAPSIQEPPLKVFISVDMEGISGVVHSEMTSASGSEYARGRRLMTAEVNAAIQGALDAGATEILVNDAHGSMRNVLIEELLVPARLISNNSKSLGMMEGMAADFDAVFFIGYHAMAGRAGLLAHTGTGQIVEIRVNGQPQSEGGLNARVAGALGVPVVLATGDEDFVAEIRELLGGELETVAVKTAIRRQTAEQMHPEEARRAIRAAASRALARRAEIAPTRPAVPVAVEMTYRDPDLADIAALIPTVERAGLHSIRFQSSDYLAAYRLIRVLYRNLTN